MIFLIAVSIHGTIPESFRELSGLGTLNLRRNALEGVIPDIWGNMPPSFALDISENGRFHTPLPTSLVRRVLFRPENILLDPYLYDCPPGYHAPLDSDGERHATDALLDTVSNRTLADLCKACPKGKIFSQATFIFASTIYAYNIDFRHRCYKRCSPMSPLSGRYGSDTGRFFALC